MFPYSVETKAEPLFQSNKSLDPCFEIKISFLAVPRITCLSPVKKENTIIFIIQILCEHSIFTWLIFIIFTTTADLKKICPHPSNNPPVFSLLLPCWTVFWRAFLRVFLAPDLSGASCGNCTTLNHYQARIWGVKNT